MTRPAHRLALSVLSRLLLVPLIGAALAATPLVLLGPPAAWADDPPKPEEPNPEEKPEEKKPARDATPEEAAPLVEGLKTAAKKKKASEALPFLEKIVELKHPDFEKPLLKLMTHADAQVALRAAELLEERLGKDCGKLMWAASWSNAANDKRILVKGKALRALGRIGYVLDKRQFDDVVSVWRNVVASAMPDLAPALVDMAFYFEVTKDKRLCRLLAEELTEPMSTAPASDASNPPAAWWEARWKIWKETKPAAVAALKAITGQEFDETEKAKAWFEENKKTFGFDW